MSTRDNQRARLYRAEAAAAASLGQSKYEQSIANADLQPWVDKILGKATIRRRWPEIPHITVTLKRGGTAYGYRGRREITLPQWSRNEWVVLHEMAHVLNPTGLASHGPEFAGVLVYLVEQGLGRQSATALRQSFSEHRVRKNSASVPSPKMALDKWLNGRLPSPTMSANRERISA